MSNRRKAVPAARDPHHVLDGEEGPEGHDLDLAELYDLLEYVRTFDEDLVGRSDLVWGYMTNRSDVVRALVARLIRELEAREGMCPDR